MPEAILSNRYKILKKLGEGGFGQTFLAEDLHLPTAPQCVVKRLKPEFADDESYKLARRLFEQEAEILYRMGNHPNIPNLLAHFEENGEFFLAQELIEGWTLTEEFASEKRYDEREAIDLLRQILETLAFVHSQNVIHRDIKPSNLIRRASDGRIFLIDFGAVKQVSVNPFNQNLTFQSTVAIGSHGYMPPEQTAGKPRFASDLYAAGLVVIEALTGMNPLQLNQNRTTGEFLWQHKARVHAEIGNFVSRLVRYDFRQRHMSAKEAFAGLNMLASSLGLARKNPVFVQPIQPIPIPMPLAAKQPEREILAPTVPAAHQFQKTLVNMSPNSAQTVVKEESKGFFDSLWNNDIALGVVVVAVVFGCFFVLGYAVVRYALASSEKVQPESSISAPVFESKTSKAYEEAENQANEAEEKEKRATTKNDWDEIGNQYKRAYSLMSAIDAASADYANAQDKMRDYQRKSEYAYQKSAEANTYNTIPVSNSSTTNYPASSNYPGSSYPSSSSYPTPTPAKAKPVVTMPGKQSYGTYLSYNIVNYDKLENKVITTNDAIFTTSVEKQSQTNKRDSGVVHINIEGGSYSSARLAFKAPFGQKVTAGNFPYAQEYLWQSPTMYAVSFDKLSCFENGNHSFTINNIIYDELYSSIAFIDATFTIKCGDRKVMGRIRYDGR
ncbi:MAG TPA: serine/threonine-protein kinase [Pyrinomonadaceae bacterium]|jgi:serine/threonine protein kinase